MAARFGVLLLCLATTMAAVPPQNMALYEVIEGSNEFSTDFFRTVGKYNKGNLVSSPLSASIALSMAAHGAAGNTKKEMKRVLHLPAKESVSRSGYHRLMDTLNNVEGVELNVANKMFVSDDFSVKPSFYEYTTSVYRSPTENVNFGDNVAAVQTINNWCEEQTNHHIKDLLQPSDVNALTRVVLVNAVYFKGQWKKQFLANQTEDRPFHLTKDTVKNVPTMYQKGHYKYGVLPEMKARYVEIPYKNENVSMVIILPDEIDGLSKVEEKLALTNLAEVLRTGHKADVNLYLPKFKIESTIQMNDILKQMGMGEMFDEHKADFSGISDINLYVTNVIQKAFIEVNEEGSEATASTDVQIGLKGRRSMFMFVDHPFLVVLRQNLSDVFVGRVVEPKYD